MFVSIVRVFIIYFVVLVFLRIMGKRQIGEMQPFELVITLIIADLATMPMSDSGIPLINGLLPLAVLVIIHFVLTFLSRKSIIVRTVISGSPVIVINPKGIDYQSIKQLNMTVDDLQESLRELGYFKLEQIEYAIIETNGKLSVLPTADATPAQAKDVNAKNPPPKIPYLVISDGQLNSEMVKQSGKSQNEIQSILRSKKVHKLKDVIAMTIDMSNNVYLQTKNKPFISFNSGGGE